IRQELEKLEGDEVVTHLNENFRENPEVVMDLFEDMDKDEFSELCRECNARTYTQRDKPYCDVHKNVDGNTYDIKVLYALDVAVAYDTTSRQWIRYFDDMGED